MSFSVTNAPEMQMDGSSSASFRPAALDDVLPLLLYHSLALLKQPLRLSEGLRLLSDAGVSLAVCKEQLLDCTLFTTYTQCVAATAWLARTATVSKDVQSCVDASVFSPTLRRVTAARFLRLCRQLESEASAPPHRYIVNQLAFLLGDERVADMERRFRLVTKARLVFLKPYLFKSLRCLLFDPEEIPRYLMTCVSDMRVLCFMIDVLEEHGLEAGEYGIALGASLIRIPPRTAATQAAILATLCSTEM